MNAEQRIWRTSGGELVLESDAEAATLAYAVGDEVAPADREAVEDLLTRPTAKSRRPAANKAAAKPEDK